jgi:hypothetical protein
MRSGNLFGTFACALFVLAASSAAALDQNDPADGRLVAGNGEASPPSLSETMADQSQCAGGCDVGCCLPCCCCPRWTVSADFIILDRIGGTNQALVSRTDSLASSGTVVLTGNDFRQGFSGGPRIDLIRHGDSDYDWELSYFQISGWASDRFIAADPVDWHWLTMSAPGAFLQTNQKAGQGMAWDYSSQLYDAEINVRCNPSSRVTMLAGFRWVNLGEKLVGALQPPTYSREPPFWNSTTINNFYGLQVGADCKLFERGRFSIDALVKTGVYDNDAEETTGVSVIAKQVRAGSASTDRPAFVGETGLQCKYQVTERLLFRAGYEAIWLEGVALAPGQIQETRVTLSPMSAQARGVNCNSGVFYHGATAGLEYSF